MKTNDEFKHFGIKSQNGRILKHLLQGRKLTQVQALSMFGCLRLSARIYDLTKSGIDVRCDVYVTPKGKRVGQYYMTKEEIRRVSNVM